MQAPLLVQKFNGSSSQPEQTGHPEYTGSPPTVSSISGCPDAAPALRLRLFGPLDARRGAVSLPRLRSRKEQWLLALLALRGPAAVDRVWLAGTLWPECPEGRALSNLRRSLSTLRAALGTAEGEWIISPKPGTLALSQAGLEVDVRAFDAAVARGDDAALEKAVALYCGPLLEGCLEEWAVVERRVREEAYLQAREKLAARMAERGETQAAAQHLRLILEIDPFREAALRRLMETLSEGGEPLAARRAYRDFRRLLRTEMNARPAPQTQALFRRLQSAEAAVPKPTLRLPHALTPLVGRQWERREAAEALDAARLVTLTGVGGVGKTRLAIAVAQDCAEEYADGVWFVDLSPLSDPQLLSASVAAALGLRVQGDSREALDSFLRARSVLLVLDNCEHLLASCAALASGLLGVCPGLRLLATSRGPLGLFGEVVWPVPPLSLTDMEGIPDAVRLFAERTRQAGGPQRLDVSLRPTMMAICQRLDGLPLAIELAAARTRSMTLEQIAQRLDDCLGLLRQGARTAHPRHQTLRATLDWSYNMLTAQEKVLLCRLSVFAGGWTLAAAEVVCAGDVVDGREVLDLLTSLVDKSLVVCGAGDGGVSRYRLLETVRQYAGEHLGERGETETVRDGHLSWCVALAEEALPRLFGLEQGSWLTRLETEHDNLRAGLLWAGMSSGGAARGLQLAGALGQFWYVRGYWSEGRSYLTTVLAWEGAADGARARALRLLGWLVGQTGDGKTARSLWEQSLAISREIGDPAGEASALNNLGWAEVDEGNWEASCSLYEQSLAISREIGDPAGEASVINRLGLVKHAQGDWEASQSYFEQALAINHEVGDRGGKATNLLNLGILKKDQGNFEASHSNFEQALAISRAIGNRVLESKCLNSLGLVKRAQSNFEASRFIYEQALAINREIENSGGQAYYLNNLGLVKHAQGDWEASRSYFEQALAIFREIGDRNGEAWSLTSLGYLAQCQGGWESSRSSFEQSLAIYCEIGDREGEASNLTNLGIVAREQGNLAQARALFTESLARKRQLGTSSVSLYTLEEWAALALAERDARRAARLAGAAHAAISTSLCPHKKDRHARMLSAAHAALGDEAFTEAWNAGRAMTLDEAVKYALADKD